MGGSIQSLRSSTTTLKSSYSSPKQMRQLCSLIASYIRYPEAPESFDATHVMSAYKKLRGTFSGKSSHSSKAAHVGFYHRGFIHVRVILTEDSATIHPGLMQISSVRRHPTPYHQLPNIQPDSASPTSPCGKRLKVERPPPYLPWCPCLPWPPLSFLHLQPGRHEPPFPIGTSTLRCGP